MAFWCGQCTTATYTYIDTYIYIYIYIYVHSTCLCLFIYIYEGFSQLFLAILPFLRRCQFTRTTPRCPHGLFGVRAFRFPRCRWPCFNPRGSKYANIEVLPGPCNVALHCFLVKLSSIGPSEETHRNIQAGPKYSTIAVRALYHCIGVIRTLLERLVPGRHLKS